MSETVHKFEAAGLGKAPFRFTGMTENLFTVPGCPEATKPGGSCDYCSTSIRYEFHILSADGHAHKVGCDCIRKVGDAGLERQTDQAMKAHKQEVARAKARAVAVELQQFIFDRQTELAARPHPRGYSDRKTGAALSMLDYARWTADNCGAKGSAEALAYFKKQLSPRPYFRGHILENN